MVVPRRRNLLNLISHTPADRLRRCVALADRRVFRRAPI
jgi:hypothetical protein